jgi:hypothetical protein
MGHISPLKFSTSKGSPIILLHNIKSTLSSLPVYFMFLFSLLASVANYNEKLQRDFLCGGLGKEFKCHLDS